MRILIVILFIYLSAAIYPQWIDRTGDLPDLGNTNARISMDAPDSLNAVITLFENASNKFSIFKTSNAGINWNEISLPDSINDFHIVDISMPAPSKIWLCGRNFDSLGTSYWKILYTENDGVDWKVQHSEGDYTFFSYIDFFDESTGVCFLESWDQDFPVRVLHTNNGGENWTAKIDTSLRFLYTWHDWRDIQFITPTLGFFKSKYSHLYKTTDGGNNWFGTNLPLPMATPIKFYDKNFGLAFGGDDVSKTIDSGNSWEQFQINISGENEDCEFVPGVASRVWHSTRIGYDDFKLFFSSDSGYTWDEYPIELTSKISDIHFVDTNHGWLLTNTKVFYTNNGGQFPTNIENEIADLPHDFSLYQNYPNPFNPTTKIKFNILNVETGHAPSLQTKLVIFDLLGQEITTLLNKPLEPGTYEIEFDGSNLPSGMYFYKLQSAGRSITKKLMLLK